MNNDCLKNFGGQSPKEDFCKVSDKKILNISIQIYKENKPRPLAAMFFFTNHNGLNNFGRGSPKEHFCQII